MYRDGCTFLSAHCASTRRCLEARRTKSSPSWYHSIIRENCWGPSCLGCAAVAYLCQSAQGLTTTSETCASTVSQTPLLKTCCRHILYLLPLPTGLGCLHRGKHWCCVLLQSVTSVRKRKNLGFPNSIEVQWGENRREFFTSFVSREEAYKLIIGAWSQAAPESAAVQLFRSKGGTGDNRFIAYMRNRCTSSLDVQLIGTFTLA